MHATPRAGRMTGSGRSPGLRVIAVARLPEHSLSGIVDNGLPLTVAGAAPVLALPIKAGLTGFPIRRLAPAPGPRRQSTARAYGCQCLGARKGGQRPFAGRALQICDGSRCRHRRGGTSNRSIANALPANAHAVLERMK